MNVRLSAVQRAIADGRLTPATVGYDAKKRPFIRDLASARREWQAHTRPRVAPQHGPPPSDGSAATPSTLALATQREREARAKLAELAYQRQVRALVPAREVEALWSERVVVARTNMLGLPTRAKQRLPHLTLEDLAVLEQLQREICDELAGDETKGESA